jgi:hypothetical protein
LTELSNEVQAEPRRQIATGGIRIVLGNSAQRALPAESAMPLLEMEPADEWAIAGDILGGLGGAFKGAGGGAPGVSGTPNPAAPYTTGAPYWSIIVAWCLSLIAADKFQRPANT